MPIIDFNPKRENIEFAARMAIMHAKAKNSVVRFCHNGVAILVTGETGIYDVERMYQWARSTDNCSIGPNFTWTEEKQSEYQEAEKARREKWNRSARLRERAEWLHDAMKNIHGYLNSRDTLDVDDVRHLRTRVKEFIQHASGEIIE